jgi:hypothetical protein
MKVKYLCGVIFITAILGLMSSCEQDPDSMDMPPLEKSEKEKLKERSDAIFVYKVDRDEAVIIGIKSFDPALIGEDGVLIMSEYIGKIIEQPDAAGSKSVVNSTVSSEITDVPGNVNEPEVVETFGGYKIKKIERIQLFPTPAVPAVLDENGNVITEAIPEIQVTMDSDCIKAIKTLVLPIVPANNASIMLNPDDIVIVNPPADDAMHYFLVNGKNWYLGGKKMKGIYKREQYKDKNIKVFDMRYLELTPESPLQTTDIGINGNVLTYNAVFATAYKGVQNSEMERIIIPDGFTCLEQFAGPLTWNSNYVYFQVGRDPYTIKLTTKSGNVIPRYAIEVTGKQEPVEEEPVKKEPVNE